MEPQQDLLLVSAPLLEGLWNGTKLAKGRHLWYGSKALAALQDGPVLQDSSSTPLPIPSLPKHAAMSHHLWPLGHHPIPAPHLDPGPFLASDASIWVLVPTEELYGLLEPVCVADVEVLKVERIQLIDAVLNLCTYHHPENIQLPPG